MYLRVLIALIVGFSLYASNYKLNAETINVSDDYRTIQEAVDKASERDTIVVREGEYRENVVINKTIVIESEKGAEKTIVKAANSDEPVFKIENTDHVILKGFTATGSSVAGIYIGNTVNTEISGNRIIKNRSGIVVYSSNNSKISNNVSNFNKLTGIYLESSHNNTLDGNEANSNEEKGIFLNSSNENSIVNNTVNRNEWNGITMWVSNNNRVEKNEVMRNTYSIVINGSSDNMVNDNYMWTNYYLILPILLIYFGIVLFFIQRKIFSLIYSEI